MLPIGIYDRLVSGLLQLEFIPQLMARITLGGVFIESGWGKLHNLNKVTEYFQSLGIPAAHIQAPFAAGCELVCGAAVLVGLFTRLSAIPLMVIMVVAILTAKREELDGVSALFGFIEYLYIVLLLWLVVRGGGCLSLDRLLVTWRKASTA